MSQTKMHVCVIVTLLLEICEMKEFSHTYTLLFCWYMFGTWHEFHTGCTFFLVVVYKHRISTIIITHGCCRSLNMIFISSHTNIALHTHFYKWFKRRWWVVVLEWVNMIILWCDFFFFFVLWNSKKKTIFCLVSSFLLIAIRHTDYLCESP